MYLGQLFGLRNQLVSIFAVVLLGLEYAVRHGNEERRIIGWSGEREIRRKEDGCVGKGEGMGSDGRIGAMGGGHEDMTRAQASCLT